MFAKRHIGPTEADVAEMLRVCEASSLEELIQKSLPSAIHSEHVLDLPVPKTEAQVLERLRELASQNQTFTSMLGLGYYNTFMPSVIQRNVLENPAWYTAYTPYQPEISQGRLELLLAFQTMVVELTGMDLANASLLDEATAAAEAMTLLARIADAENTPGSKNMRFGVDINCYPQTLGVLKTRAEPLGIEILEASATHIPDDCFGVFLQLETTNGHLQDLEPAISTAHSKGTLVCVGADPLALCLVVPPGEQGADVVIGSMQRFGVPMGFGGPHAGYIAVRDEYQRALPGRLVGTSKDTQDRTAYRLTLQTREQHIRKERATSNICTAQVLLAIISALYGMYHTTEGLIQIAQHVHNSALAFQNALSKKNALNPKKGEQKRGGPAGIEIVHSAFFGTLLVKIPQTSAAEICKRAEAHQINLRQVGSDTIAIAFDETTTEANLADLCNIFGLDSGPELAHSSLISKPSPISKPNIASAIPTHLQRQTSPISHPMFSKNWSETEFVRYLKQLADKDLALDHSMIPLGSCTMKLNSSTEMMPISWPGFANIHPFAPSEQTQGYTALLKELSDALVEITGMSAASLQPNAGSQGELAGLLAIRAYHKAASRKDSAQAERNVCLIPTSAHGTNAASAVMAGMKVIPVACDAEGNVDIADLEQKTRAHSKDLAAFMVTYPSTHGIFEPQIKEICEQVHACGGQVYMDGANLNALIGLARPGDFGIDVSHLNLHKTFCIPHGGGGPGMGPIVVKEHLVPYLPSHPLIQNAADLQLGEVGPVSAAPWGSAGILPISWSYIQLMGGDGLTSATKTAILAANYLASRLAEHFPILYTGQDGKVAHECVLDLRAYRNLVSVEDVAKRLMDYGFHAPTVSFPVADTLMVEPTESESKAELDRFIQAMISIRGEIQKIETGEWDAQNNPLKLAPHTAEDVISEDWDRPYTRETAVYPLAYLRQSKYWPPVNRIDSAWGDRNLFCTCPVF